MHAGLGDVFVFELDAEFFGGPFKAGEQFVAAFGGRVDKFGNRGAVGILFGEQDAILKPNNFLTVVLSSFSASPFLR